MKLPWWMARAEFWIATLVVTTFTYAHFTEPPRPREAQRAAEPSLKAIGPSDMGLILTAQTDVRRMLKDPGSAEFGRAYVSRRGGPAVVCGTVNARNSFGGMTGAQRYVANAAIAAIEEQVEDAGFEEVWRKMC